MICKVDEMLLGVVDHICHCYTTCRQKGTLLYTLYILYILYIYFTLPEVDFEIKNVKTTIKFKYSNQVYE